MSDHIHKLYRLLGRETVLLPVPKGKKGPVIKAWQSVKFAETQDDEYQANLRGGNVGVVLGGPSGGLCAIDIDDDQDMEPFFALNPGLRHTLISRGARGCQIWVRVLDDNKFRQLHIAKHPKTHPISFKFNYRNKVNQAGVETAGQFGEWRADGGQSIIYGQHPDGNDYGFINEAQVLEVRFRDILWLPTLDELPWANQVDEALTRVYGDPWVEDHKGNIKLMIEPFWAGLFAHRYEVVYEKDEERFYLYDASRGLWERATDQDVSYKGTQMMLEVSREQNQPVLQGPRFRGSAKLSAVNNHLKGIVGRRDIFKNKRGLIHLKNGMVDLTESEDGALRLMAHAPDYYSRNQIPVAFDGDAECPRFLDDLVRRALGSEDEVKLLQRWAGMLLLQDNIYQKLMILSGTGGGGKSTILSVLQKIMGQDNCAQLRTEQLLERFEMAAYIGKTALIGSDVPGNFLMQRGAYKLKQLTGGDFFQAEIKTARDLVTLYGNYNVGITCNSRLRLLMDSDAAAWQRRLILLYCNAPPPEKKIANFDDWLVKNEGSGILNWAIEGALDILAAGRFDMTDSQSKVVQDLIEESDSMRSFLRRCVQKADRTQSVTTDELIEAYHDFCDDRGWDAAAAGTLEKHLPNIMLELFRVNKSNNIKRDGTARRGYTRVKLVKLDDESAIYDEDEAQESFSQTGLIDDESAGSGYGGEDS